VCHGSQRFTDSLLTPAARSTNAVQSGIVYMLRELHNGINRPRASFFNAKSRATRDNRMPRESLRLTGSRKQTEGLQATIISRLGYFPSRCSAKSGLCISRAAARCSAKLAEFQGHVTLATLDCRARSLRNRAYRSRRNLCQFPCPALPLRSDE